MPEEASIGGPGVRHPVTAWSAVRESREGSVELALPLIEIYWKPVYFFIRRKGHDGPSAGNLTRSFFAEALEPDFLRQGSGEKRSFRSYILESLPRFLARPRGSGPPEKACAFNFAEAEKELAAADSTPLGAFKSTWAVGVLARGMGRLRADTPPEDLALLTGSARPDLTPQDRKNRLVRLRGRLRECLKEELRPTVNQESDLEPEIRELFAAMK